MVVENWISLNGIVDMRSPDDTESRSAEDLCQGHFMSHSGCQTGCSGQLANPTTQKSLDQSPHGQLQGHQPLGEVQDLHSDTAVDELDGCLQLDRPPEDHQVQCDQQSHVFREQFIQPADYHEDVFHTLTELSRVEQGLEQSRQKTEQNNTEQSDSEVFISDQGHQLTQRFCKRTELNHPNRLLERNRTKLQDKNHPEQLRPKPEKDNLEQPRPLSEKDYSEQLRLPSDQPQLLALPQKHRRRSPIVRSLSEAGDSSEMRCCLRSMRSRRYCFESSSAGYESAIIGEAHGLITDMLANTSLPPHIISGLRAVSNLLKPPEAQGSFHKPRVSPLVSLTENTNYGSDSEESPYTGERPSTLPKRLRRSLPPSLIRRMSTSTWTTTTSATGMPTLEPEPCRLRSSSFKHSREGTPGSSPNGSRSNSPSPSAMSNSTTVLTIPKSRSFSLASTPSVHPSYQRRLSSRRSMAESSVAGLGTSPTRQDSKPGISPLARAEETPSEAEESGSVCSLPKDVSGSALIQKRFVTSDYESSDSPSSSDHSDNVCAVEDLATSRKELLRATSKVREKVPKPPDVTDTDVRPDNEEEADGEASERGRGSSGGSDRTLGLTKSVTSETIRADDVQELLFDPEQELDKCQLLQMSQLNEWDYPIFELAECESCFILTKVAYRVFTEVGLMETFRIPIAPFLHYFHDLELGYRDKPYHNRIHATDVLHGVYYLTTQPIPGFTQINPSDVLTRQCSSSESDSDTAEHCYRKHRPSFMAEDSYGIMGGNLPALELMALYTAAAMHDYDHPGRTNAFLVATTAPQAVLYNDRSVLENHHAAAAWSLLLNHDKNYFISGLEAAEFKRFRYLVIEAILATDLKRHFEILAEFNAKVNDEEASGIDWTLETDRLLVTQMVIKLADINGPSKRQDLHQQWTYRIAEEFYDQGDEEANLGLPISPYMDRHNPQLAKLQETFINHLVSPLCNAMVTGGLLPGTWVDLDPQEVLESGENSTEKDTEDDENDTDNESGLNDEKECKSPPRKVNCLLTKNLKDNYEFWAGILKKEEEEQRKSASENDTPTVTVVPPSASNKDQVMEKTEMEPIEEESESPPLSAECPPTPPHQASTLTPSSNSAFQSRSLMPVPAMDADSSTSV